MRRAPPSSAARATSTGSYSPHAAGSMMTYRPRSYPETPRLRKPGFQPPDVEFNPQMSSDSGLNPKTPPSTHKRGSQSRVAHLVRRWRPANGFSLPNIPARAPESRTARRSHRGAAGRARSVRAYLSMPSAMPKRNGPRPSFENARVHMYRRICHRDAYFKLPSYPSSIGHLFNSPFPCSLAPIVPLLPAAYIAG